MKLQLQDDLIPGTKLKRAEMDGLTGLAFLKKVFFISNGVMLSQIREISGIDSSTLQNWTKRGWVANSRSKKYNIDQVAHILIINMLRSCMQLDSIAFLIQFINGDIEDTDDDIIRDSELYDYICRILNILVHTEHVPLSDIGNIVKSATQDYQEPIAGGKKRLDHALEVIVVAYYAALLKHHADTLLQNLHEMV